MEYNGNRHLPEVTDAANELGAVTRLSQATCLRMVSSCESFRGQDSGHAQREAIEAYRIL